MKLLSAYEDFVQTTLSQIPNVLDRLRFIARMRKGEQYEHWGLAKVFGKEAAQRAISDSHADTFEQTLTTPIPKLDVETESSQQNSSLSNRQMLPADLRGGSRRHLNWILRVVYLLGRSRRCANPGA